MQQAALIPRTIALPPWLPAHVRERLSGQPVAFVLPKTIRRRLHHPEKISISEHAARYRVVTGVDADPGPWRQEKVPHTVKVMDLIGKPHVRQVWIAMPDREGKTQILLNTINWFVDQRGRSGNIFYLLPTEKDSRDAIVDRVIPMFKASPRTRKYLSNKVDDSSSGKVLFTTGVRLRASWANSPASMASYFGRLNIIDECDKFPLLTTEVTNPIKQILKRGREDRTGSKYVFASTPGRGKYITKGVNDCQQVWELQARCPHCEQYQTMSIDNFRYPAEANADTITGEQITIICTANGCTWSEADRMTAYQGGRWHCRQGAEIFHPETVGAHTAAFPFPNIPALEIVKAKLAADHGGLEEKTAYANGYEVKDYIPEQVGAINVERVLKFRSTRPADQVPPDTAMLALLIDTQQTSFIYQLWSYSYAPEITMHMVRHGVVDAFADLEGLLAKDWLDSSDKTYRISAGLIDSGGTRQGWQKHSRTVEVYEWCSRHRAIRPHKGMAGRNGDLLGFKNIDSYPGSGKKIPGGLVRVNLRVDLFKDDLEHRLGKEPGDPGALSFHAGIDEHFALTYTAESKNEAGDWIHNRKIRNDPWDCNVYAVALRDIHKLRIPKKPEPGQAQPTRRIISKGVQR